MSTVPGAVPTALVTAMNKPGGGDKPFTYCPGGVDFSELRSPKMSKRIAKNNQGNGTNVQHFTSFDPMSGTINSSNYLNTLPDTAWRNDCPVGTVENPIKPVKNSNYLQSDRKPEESLQALAALRKVHEYDLKVFIVVHFLFAEKGQK